MTRRLPDSGSAPAPGAEPDGDLPRNPEELQVHLALDQPDGRRVASLRDYYAEHPETVLDARACVDQCNEYIEFTISGCWVCGVQRTSTHDKTCANHREFGHDHD